MQEARDQQNQLFMGFLDGPPPAPPLFANKLLYSSNLWRLPYLGIPPSNPPGAIKAPASRGDFRNREYREVCRY